MICDKVYQPGKSADPFFRHRSKQLLIPYVCFFLVFYAFWLVAGRKIGDGLDVNIPFYEPILEYLYGRPYHVCWPLWFVPCLFLMQCLFYALNKWVKNKSGLTLLLLVFPFVPYIIDLSGTPFMFNLVCSYIPFYGVAFLYRDYLLRFLEGRKRYILALGFFILYLFLVWTYIEVDDSYLKIAIKTLACFSVIVPLFVLLKALSSVFGRVKIVEYITTNAIVVLACHTYLIRIFQLLIVHFIGKEYWADSYWLKFGIVIAILFLMLIPIWGINRYLPFMLGKGRLFEKK
ncbi:acyltransferase [Dysgonomonas sp. PH5-45]|uniref:acyltransferase family protein n=1 Tax=unclassified Dysgonomonas TaxID=2630389 RepID=UPI0024747D80|nr:MULTISPECIES: acyltransferase [unclassified Dysgonomonas]MDH6355436.1 acyltransferase [Dysgonomonas sp. PH5-45]MDH6388333.1 acyltransferase [Dysgonomonas sp. PH5-37]